MSDATSLRADIERLCVKRNATLGNMPRRDLQLTLCLAALAIPSATSLSEPQVNDALQQWLAGTGSMLRIDHVELRRHLIDAGLWQRDGFGRQYERATSIANEELAAMLRSLVDMDVAFIAETARRQHAQARDVRKSRTAAQSANASQGKD